MLNLVFWISLFLLFPSILDDPFWEGMDFHYWATVDYEWYVVGTASSPFRHLFPFPHFLASSDLPPSRAVSFFSYFTS
jgi:hypothetical protein